MSTAPGPALPEGVVLRKLKVNTDARGSLAEVYREDWELGPRKIQWEVIDSRPNVLRGMRLHLRRDDYVTVLRGVATIGYRDVRRGSPTEGKAGVVRLSADDLSVVTIPSGIVHGLYSNTEVLYLVGITGYNDGTDEQSCRWDAEGLGIDWPFAAPSPLISPNDEGQFSVAELAALTPPWRPG